MSQESLLEIYKQQQNLNEKHTYFLLAAAGAAIGFAVQKTEGELLSLWLAPVALAILCWGTSFYYGCRHIAAWQQVMFLNSDMLELRKGTHRLQPRSAVELQIALEVVHEKIDKGVKKTTALAHAQFRLLIEGAVLFVAWRVLEIVRATYQF